MSLGLLNPPEQKEETPSDPIIKYLENFLSLRNIRYVELTVSVVGRDTISYVEIHRNGRGFTGLVDSGKMSESIGIGKIDILQRFIDNGSNVLEWKPGFQVPFAPKLRRRIR